MPQYIHFSNEMEYLYTGQGFGCVLVAVVDILERADGQLFVEEKYNGNILVLTSSYSYTYWLACYSDALVTPIHASIAALHCWVHLHGHARFVTPIP